MNRYYKPERSQVLSNYVALPFDAIQKRLDIDQAQADEFETDFDKALAEKASAISGDYSYAQSELNKHKDAARQSVLDAGGNPFLAKSSFSKAKAGLTKSMTDGALYAYKVAHDTRAAMEEQASKYDKQDLETFRKTMNRLDREYNAKDDNGNSGMAAGRSWGQGNTDIRFSKHDVDKDLAPFVANIKADVLKTATDGFTYEKDINGIVTKVATHELKQLTVDKVKKAVQEKLLFGEWKDNERERLRLTEGLTGDDATKKIEEKAEGIANAYAHGMTYKEVSDESKVDVDLLTNKDGSTGVKKKDPYGDIEGSVTDLTTYDYKHETPKDVYTAQVQNLAAFTKDASLYTAFTKKSGESNYQFALKIANMTPAELNAHLKKEDASRSPQLIADAKRVVESYNDNIENLTSALTRTITDIKARDKSGVAGFWKEPKTGLQIRKSLVPSSIKEGTETYNKALALMLANPDADNKDLNENINAIVGIPNYWQNKVTKGGQVAEYLKGASKDFTKGLLKKDKDGSYIKEGKVNRTINYSTHLADNRFNLNTIMQKSPGVRTAFLDATSSDNRTLSVRAALLKKYNDANPDKPLNAMSEGDVQFLVAENADSPTFKASFGGVSVTGNYTLGVAPSGQGVASINLRNDKADYIQAKKRADTRLNKSTSGVISLTGDNSKVKDDAVMYKRDELGLGISLAKGAKILRGDELTHFMAATTGMTYEQIREFGRKYVTNAESEAAVRKEAMDAYLKLTSEEE